MVQRLISLGVFTFLFSFTSLSYAAELSLEDYLKQVREGNDDIKSLDKSSRGAKMRSNEASFVVSPQIFGEISYGEDKALPQSLSQPNDARKTTYSLGIQEQFPFGLNSKFYYSVNKYDLRGMAPSAKPLYTSTDYFTAKPTLEFSLSLYKNLFGREVRAQRDLLKNQGVAKHWVDSFKSKVLLVEAEVAYWKLALSRTLVQSAKENIARAGKMKAWSTRRKKLGLADESQFLQADANYELRQLEYMNALDEERSSRRKLNTMRGVDTDLVEEELSAPAARVIFELPVSDKYVEREDLKAARAEVKLKKANAIVNGEKFKPDLQLFGSYAWNGKENSLSDAMDEGFKNDRRTYGVGVKFTMPLDVLTLSKQVRGYKLEERAAVEQLSRREFESKREWQELKYKFLEGRERFKILLKIEIAQNKKLLRERELQDRGRSTLFNVLQFESEYAQAQISRTRAEIELLGLYAQLKTYQPLKSDAELESDESIKGSN